MATVAVMQPYLFPYIGYFQLVSHVDFFVFLDDANFIKRGYIARNVVRGGGSEPVRFLLGVEKASQNRSIREHRFIEDYRKALSSIQFCYSGAANFDRVMPLVRNVLRSPDRNVARLTSESVREVAKYLGLRTEFRYASEFPNPACLRGQERIIDICGRLEGARYVNPIGGLDLYSRETFAEAGIHLGFIKMQRERIVFDGDSYTDFSIIDALMRCPVENINEMLACHEVI